MIAKRACSFSGSIFSPSSMPWIASSEWLDCRSTLMNVSRLSHAHFHRLYCASRTFGIEPMRSLASGLS